MVFSRFGSGRQSWQLQASKASFLVASESDVRQWYRGFGSAVARHAMVFSRFGSGRQSWQLQASKASFLVGSESDVRHWHRSFGSAVGTGMPCEAWRLEDS